MENLTPSTGRGKVVVIPEEVTAKMKGGVYCRKNGTIQVHFRGKWFGKDQYGQTFKAEFYAWAFLEHLNALYDPDPAKNRYDPSKFKDHTPHKFDEAFELYLDRKQTDSAWHRWKEWTWKKYFMPYFSNQDFRTIDGVQLVAFQRWLEKKNLKGKTIKNIFMCLHGFLNYPPFRRSINVFPEFPVITYQRQRPRKFSDREIDQVFEFVIPADQGYFLFIRYYGVRPEEASGLLKRALNWEIGEITISTVYVDGKVKPRTKTLKERNLLIIPEIEPYLKQPGDTVFVFHVGGRPYSQNMRERRWNKAMAQASKKYGTRKMTLRDLRSSATSRWLRKGMKIQDAAQLLGNSPEIIRENYSDQVEDKVVNIVRGKG